MIPKGKKPAGFWTEARCIEAIEQSGKSVKGLQQHFPAALRHIYTEFPHLKALLTNSRQFEDWTEEKLLAVMEECNFEWQTLLEKYRGAYDCLDRVRHNRIKKRDENNPHAMTKKLKNFPHLVAMMHNRPRPQRLKKEKPAPKPKPLPPTREDVEAALAECDYVIGKLSCRFKNALRRLYHDLHQEARQRKCKNWKPVGYWDDKENIIKAMEEVHYSLPDFRKKFGERPCKRLAECPHLMAQMKTGTVQHGDIMITEDQAAYLRGEKQLSKNFRIGEEECRRVLEECGFDMQRVRKTSRTVHTKIYANYRHLLDLIPNRRSYDHLRVDHPEWTYEYCVQFFRENFKQDKQFRKEHYELMIFVERKGWLNDVKVDAGILPESARKMTYQKARAIIREAIDYDEFVEQYPGVHDYVLSNKSLKETLIGHFRGLLRLKEQKEGMCHAAFKDDPNYRRSDTGFDTYRCIYVCKFEQTHTAYVGLTDDPARRRREHGQISHIGKSQVAKYKWENGLNFVFEKLTDFMPEAEAQVAEDEWKRKYQAEGWTMLNIGVTGNLGGIVVNPRVLSGEVMNDE